MRHLLLVQAAAIVLLPSLAASQQKPELTGTWVMDATRSASAANRVPGPGEAQSASASEVLVIQQTPDALIVERRRGNTSETISYSFSAEPTARTTAVAPDQTASAAQPTERGSGTSPVPTGTTSNAEPAARAGNDVAAVVGVEMRDARAEIKDGKVLTKLVLNVNGKTVTTEETLFLRQNGAELIIERLLRVHHGYEGATKAAVTGQDVFVRSR